MKNVLQFPLILGHTTFGLFYPISVKPLLGKMQPFARGSSLCTIKTIQAIWAK
jgi:hypothetical protein